MQTYGIIIVTHISIWDRCVQFLKQYIKDVYFLKLEKHNVNILDVLFQKR